MNYYGIRSIPYFLISMPVIAFLSQILISYQLRRRHEWHIVKLVCLSNIKISKALLITGIFLCLCWTTCRELLLPSLQLPLDSSYLKVKGKQAQRDHVFCHENTIAYIQSNDEKWTNLNITLFKDHPGQQKPVDGPLVFKWNNESKNWTSPAQIEPQQLEWVQQFTPSPRALSSQNHQYLYSTFRELLKLYLEKPMNPYIEVALAERLLYPLLFLVFFMVSAYDVLRCRENKWIWLFPGVSLIVFSTTIMMFRSISLQSNLITGLTFVAFCTLATPFLFSLYFRRPANQN